MGQTAFWGFEIVASWNLISVLISDVSVGSAWLAVYILIVPGARHGTNCFLGVCDSGPLESHVRFYERCDR